jgi:hypothetical protein
MLSDLEKIIKELDLELSSITGKPSRYLVVGPWLSSSDRSGHFKQRQKKLVCMAIGISLDLIEDGLGVWYGKNMSLWIEDNHIYIKVTNDCVNLRRI